MAAPTEASSSSAPPAEPQISAAEAKKRAKAEKQARRAAQKEQSQPAPNGAAVTPTAQGSSQGPIKSNQITQPQQQQNKGPKQKPAKPNAQDANTPTSTSTQTSLPVRQKGAAIPSSKDANRRKDNKNIELFSHLYTQPRRTTLEGATKDVHPAVLALGLQIANYEVCGSSARCVAMLLAFKEAIQTYTTPAGTSLPRHLTSHHLSPQIEYLKSCRPISESMGNAIRYLKKTIVEIDPSMAEQEAKDYLCDEVDRFIRERIVVTDQAIATSAVKQIKDGSVVLTYAKSAIVQKTILLAHANGINFRTIVVDSRPLFEGKNLAVTLMRAGLEVEYIPFSGIAHAMKAATLVLLGAHSMLSNGRLQSRVGTASIALHAHKADIPVIVLCESVKFSGKVGLDSIVLNEVAPPEELIIPVPSSTKVPETSTDDKKISTTEEDKTLSLNDFRDIPNLQILNLMYDTTPAEYIRMVICEYGSVPPSSVPVVHRLANEGEAGI